MRAVPSPPFLRRMAKGLPVTAKMMPVAKRKFGCLMGMLPPLFTKTITDWCLENVPDFHLGPGGREFRSHVTIKFGFTDSSPQTIEAVKEFFQGRPPIQVRLGGFDLFTSGYGKWKNEDGDVLFVEVDSPDLHRLNAELSAAFPCEDKYPEYKPHVTVAYLDPAVAESYRGLKAPFLNCSLILDTLEWSGADGVTEQFSLSILPQFGSKALDERKNKLGHRYCIDTDTGKRVPCPPKAEEESEKESAKEPAKKQAASKQSVREQIEIGEVNAKIRRLQSKMTTPTGEIDEAVAIQVDQLYRKKERIKVRHRMRTGKIHGQKNLGGGVSVSVVVDLGRGLKGVFKPGDGEPWLRGNIPKGTCYKREVATSAVAEILGMDDLVPPSVIREVDGRKGSIQEFVPGGRVAADKSPNTKYDGPEDRARAAAFDFVIGNSDRHDGNWLIKNDRLVLIDNGLSFPEYKDTGWQLPNNSGWFDWIVGLFRKEHVTNFHGRSDLLVAARPEVIPDSVRKWAENSDAVVDALRRSGLPDEAIDPVKDRLRLLANPKFRTFDDLLRGTAVRRYRE